MPIIARDGSSGSNSVYGPLKGETLIGSEDTLGRYPGDKSVSFGAASPEVRYRNRESTQRPMNAALDGDYYCQINSLEPKDAPISRMGEIPIRLTVSVIGDPTVEPDYASEPKQAAGDDDGDSGLGWPWVIGGLVVLVALAAGLLAALRRRRGDQGPEESAPSPGEVDAGPGT